MKHYHIPLSTIIVIQEGLYLFFDLFACIHECLSLNKSQLQKLKYFLYATFKILRTDSPNGL
jgi:hypothetical protein